MRRVSQEELDRSIEFHKLWLGDGTQGKRLDVSGLDLRGLLTGAVVPVDVPVVQELDKKILEAVSRDGCELDMSCSHTCETTHSQLGWAIHLAGQEGYRLEDKIGALAAGAIIYHASTGRVPDSFATNDEALADIETCAAARER